MELLVPIRATDAQNKGIPYNAQHMRRDLNLFQRNRQQHQEGGRQGSWFCKAAGQRQNARTEGEGQGALDKAKHAVKDGANKAADTINRKL